MVDPIAVAVTTPETHLGPKFELTFRWKGVPYCFLLTPGEGAPGRWKCRVNGTGPAEGVNVLRVCHSVPGTEREAVETAKTWIMEFHPEAAYVVVRRLR